MKNYILDSSVVIAYFVPDESNDKADEVFDKFLKKEGEIYILELTYYEVFNVLKSLISSQRMQKGEALNMLDVISKAKFKVAVPNWEKAFEYSLKYNLSFYDACYLEISLKNDLELITLDKKLKSAYLDMVK